jgi:ABC-type transporter Mla subunit MlaD
MAAALAWPAASLAQDGAQAPPERYQTPLGTFELDPQVRQKLQDLRATLNETARELGAVLREKARLTPEEKERLNRLLDQLRQQLDRLEQPETSRT